MEIKEKTDIEELNEIILNHKKTLNELENKKKKLLEKHSKEDNIYKDEAFKNIISPFYSNSSSQIKIISALESIYKLIKNIDLRVNKLENSIFKESEKKTLIQEETNESRENDDTIIKLSENNELNHEADLFILNIIRDWCKEKTKIFEPIYLIDKFKGNFYYFDDGAEVGPLKLEENKNIFFDKYSTVFETDYYKITSMDFDKNFSLEDREKIKETLIRRFLSFLFKKEDK